MCFQLLIKAETDTGKCKNNAPGYSKMYLANQAWLDTVPAPSDYQADQVANEPLEITADITFDTVTYTTAGWYEWDIQPQTTDWRPSLQGEIGQKYWQTTIPFKIAGHQALIDQAVDWAYNLRLVVLLLDNEGLYRFVGNKTLYCSVQKMDGQQGAAPGDFAGWDAELFLPAHQKLSPYYSGAITPIYSLAA